MRTSLTGKTSVDEHGPRYSKWARRSAYLSNSASRGRRRVVAYASGYTLLELLVVLIIISLVSALAVPRLAGSLSGLRFKTTAKKLAASLRYARSQATSEKVTYGALLQMDENRLLILVDPAALTETWQDLAGDEEQQGGRVPFIYELPPEIKIEKAESASGEAASGLFSILFFPSGGSTGGEIALTDETGRRFQIMVDFITGSVRLND